MNRRLWIFFGSVLLCVFTFQVTAQPQSSGTRRQTFDSDSTQSTYPFVMRLQGTFEIQDTDILIRVERGLVRSAIPKDLGENGVVHEVQVDVGLGKVVPDGWTMEANTPPQVIAMVLAPGEQRQIPALSFTISGTKGRPLADEWLAGELTVKQQLPGLPAGPLSSYACADVNLLGPTQVSRARAEAMKRTYSQS